MICFGKSLVNWSISLLGKVHGSHGLNFEVSVLACISWFVLCDVVSRDDGRFCRSVLFSKNGKKSFTKLVMAIFTPLCL